MFSINIPIFFCNSQFCDSQKMKRQNQLSMLKLSRNLFNLAWVCSLSVIIISNYYDSNVYIIIVYWFSRVIFCIIQLRTNHRIWNLYKTFKYFPLADSQNTAFIHHTKHVPFLWWLVANSNEGQSLIFRFPSARGVYCDRARLFFFTVCNLR